MRPSQNGAGVGHGKEDNLYLAGDLSATIPKTPIGLTAHLGHTFGPCCLSIGNEYTDWSLWRDRAPGSRSPSASLCRHRRRLHHPGTGRNASGAAWSARSAVAF